MPVEKQIIIKDTHEAIISRDDFKAVQAQMKTRTKNIVAPKKHLFTNVAFCADCGTGRALTKTINEEGIIKHLESRCHKEGEKMMNHIQQLERSIQKLKGEKTSLIKLLANNVITQDDYQETVDSNNREICTLSNKKKELKDSPKLSNTIQDLDALRMNSPSSQGRSS